MKNKKTKTKNYFSTNNEKYKKDRESIIEIFLKMRKLKKQNKKKVC